MDDLVVQNELIVRYRRPSGQRVSALPFQLARVRRFAQLGEVEHVRLPPGLTAQSAITQLRRHPEVQHVEPNQIFRADLTPNDPDLARLWGLHNTGQTGGVADTDVNAPEAWNVSVGSDQIVIGVIDTGVEYTHPDLAGNVWFNPAEASGTAGVDDDANGFIDDLHGIDAYNGDADPMDDHFHGTHVSGTIAARGDNGIGVVGVAWRAKIAGCKFLGAGGSGTTAGALACMDYFAALKRAGVNLVATNNSWGGGGFSQALQDAIETHNSLGVLFVAAAGNNGSDTDAYPHYPSSYPNANIISVAAIDHSGLLAGFSNYGATTVDLGAPGVDTWSLGLGGSYRSASGTSMAAPHVTGLVALHIAGDPLLTPAQIKQRLMTEGLPLAALGGKTISGLLARAPVPDADRDGLSDAWETLHGFNPNDASDATLDVDGDGLDNRAEYRAQTEPRNADSDADGLSDGAEVNTHQTDPRKADTDADELSDGAEINVHGTNPQRADSDADGLRDGAEINTHHTNPLSADTDADGFNDGEEVRFGTDPLDPADFPDTIPLANGNFEAADFAGWTVVRDASGGAAPALVPFDVNGDQVATQAARFQVGCSAATTPCPSAPTTVSQSIVSEAGTLSVTADLAVQYSSYNYEGGIFTLRIDGSIVATVAAGSRAPGIYRFPLSGALNVATGAHEIRIEMSRPFTANGDTPMQYVDNVVAQLGAGEPPSGSPPVAQFGATCAGARCFFTDQSSDTDGTIRAWLWNFGDGYVSTAQNPAHDFPRAGTYDVMLTVTDDSNLSTSVTRPVVVQAVSQPPVASFTWQCTNLACSFTDTSSDADGTITAWTWSFGDGTSSNEKNPRHTYTSAATYTVTLTVRDSQSLTATTSRQLTVTRPLVPPIASFSFVCSNLACDFSDASSDPDGTVVAWQWNFGDGTFSSTQNPRHTFPGPGSYPVTLTVTDNNAATATTTLSPAVTTCLAATNTNHYAAGRATRTGFLFYTFYALGSGTQLGSGSTNTSLQGGNGYWSLVSSCPGPLPTAPSISSISASVSNGVVTVSGSAADVNGNLGRVEVAIVAGGSQTRVTATGTSSWSATISGLAPGSYSAYAQAFDTTNLASAPSASVSITVPVAPQEQCFTAQNSAHYSAGRATRQWFFTYSYNAVGSNDALGSGTTTTSLRGLPGNFRLVASCQ